MTTSINKKKLTVILALICAFVLCMGVLAYFSDRVIGTAGFETADASEIIDVTTDGTTNPTEDPGADLEAKWLDNNEGIDEPIRPGDSFDLGYTLTNIGDSSIDVRETFILTSTEAMNINSPEFRLFLDRTKDEYGAYVGGTVVSAEAISEYQVKYTIAPYTLAKGANVAKSYFLVFDKYASNLFQDDSCTVEYLVEMRQHVDGAANGYDDWASILTSDINFGNNANYSAVPAAK